MKKIITAMGNETLNRELMKYAKYDLLIGDLFYQEAVLDKITGEKYDVFVTSSLLQGELDFYDFIVKLKRIDSTMRIIVVADEIDDFFKRKMNDFGIVDIFLDSSVNISEIIDSIDREEPISTKIEYENKINSAKVSEEIKKNYIDQNYINQSSFVVENVTQKQEVIVFNGTNGSGKTTIAGNFSKILAKKTSAKILLIDLDTFSGNIDEIFDISKIPLNVDLMMDLDKKCGLNYAAELISKNRFDSNVFDELVIRSDGVDILTGNTSLYFCQNVLNDVHYKAILDVAKEKYDFIIIDTSSNIFLDSVKWAIQEASRVFFITENNYISMKKASQLIDIYTNSWKVWKNKIKIIVNKEKGSGIDLEIVSKIFADYQLLGSIKDNEENVENSYIKILETIKYIPKTNLLNRILLNRRPNYQFNNVNNYKTQRNGVVSSAN